MRGSSRRPPACRLREIFDRDLLRASLAFGVVRGLEDRYATEGNDFFEALPGLEPWSLTVQ